MKKLLFIFFLLVGGIFAGLLYAPKYIPLDLKKKIVYYKLKDVPGKINVDDVDIDFFSYIHLKGFSWEYSDYRLELPNLEINDSILSLFLEKKYPLNITNGLVTHKTKKLLTNLKSELTIRRREDAFNLTKPCSISASVEKEGTKTYTNHSLIPSFSAKKVSLDLDKASVSKKEIKTLNMQGSLNLNTLDCSKNHLLSVILALLQEKPKHTIPVTFDPIHFAIDSGIASYRQTNFIIDNAFDLITKGTINFVSEKINMHLALTSDSLARAFDFADLPEGYMIPFTIKGSLKKPKLDTSGAVKTIALLLLQKKINPKQRKLPNAGSF